MTQKEIQEAHISLMDNGQIALTSERKNGKVRAIRVITREEVVNMAVCLYSFFKKDFPDKEVLAIPMNEENTFTLTMVKTPTEK